MCTRLHVKHALFLSDFKENFISYTGFRKILKYQISWKSIRWEPSCSMRTDGRTDSTNIKVGFCNFAKAPPPQKKEETPKSQYDVIGQTSDFRSHDNPSVWFPSKAMNSALTKRGKRLWDAARFATSNERHLLGHPWRPAYSEAPQKSHCSVLLLQKSCLFHPLMILIRVVCCITEWESCRTTTENRRREITIPQTMRVLHSSATGNFHIQGVQIVTLQICIKNNKA